MAMSKITIISIDFQKDFSAPGGKCYRPRPSVKFIKGTLVPFLRKNNISIAEIISDYRQPRPGDRGDCNWPGTAGYESEIPDDVKLSPVWIKCMNSPIWTRKNIGNPNRKPGLPYQDPRAFARWLHAAIGKPSRAEMVVLVGLTLDCCILSTAQELSWHGYDVKILAEGTDTYSGNQGEKEGMLGRPPLSNWAEAISWEELRRELER
jgi:nicotinamidase-related amidase